MNAPSDVFSPAEAAKRLGVSAKALRLYEERALLTPMRTTAGWRVYGPREMTRAAEIVALRGLGLSLAQIAQVLGGDARSLEPALAKHQARLEHSLGRLADTIARVRDLRADLAKGHLPSTGDLADLLRPASGPGVAFELPWPWGGERFELSEFKPLTYITGPLGSGKTRLIMQLAETIPGAAFLGLGRTADGASAAKAQRDADPLLTSRADLALDWLLEDGATASDALIALLVGLEAEGPAVLVVDMIEQGLDHATQQALSAHLRRRRRSVRPIVMTTRSSAILDLAAVGPDEAIILCPANHSPPTLVAPHPASPGYEAVATCLASPDVRARTAGMISWRPKVA